MNTNKIQSLLIDFLRFPMSVGVVFIHAKGLALSDQNFSNTEISIYNFIRHLFSSTFVEICVPVFFFFSGYLFFIKTEKFSFFLYKQKIKKRCKSLVLPYILWNIIGVFGYLFFNFLYAYKSPNAFQDSLNLLFTKGFFGVFWSWISSPLHDNILGYTNYLFTPINGPLWFMRDLIVISILSPLVYYLIKRFSYMIVIILGVLYILQLWIIYPGFSIAAFFFFTWGAYYSLKKVSFFEQFLKAKFLLVLFSFSILLLCSIVWGTTLHVYFMKLFIISFMMTVINFIGILIKKQKIRIIPWLSKSSLFVFATHMVVILPVVGIVFKNYLKSNSFILNLTYYFLIPIITTLICLVLNFLSEKYFKRIYKILMGNR